MFVGTTTSQVSVLLGCSKGALTPSIAIRGDLLQIKASSTLCSRRSRFAISKRCVVRLFRSGAASWVAGFGWKSGLHGEVPKPEAEEGQYELVPTRES